MLLFDNRNKMKTKIHIGIIGGGKGGFEIYQLFSNNDLSSIAFVVDIDMNAPAIRIARKNYIDTYNDIKVALRNHPVEFIIEATGSPKVLEQINKYKSDTSDVITSNVAMLLFNTLSETRKKNNEQIFNETAKIKNKIDHNLSTASKAIQDVREITSRVELLAINAEIEASHAGDAGKGFAVLATELKTTVDKMISLTNVIGVVNKEVSGMSDDLEQLVKKIQ